jgi:hypothetical protein
MTESFSLPQSAAPADPPPPKVAQAAAGRGLGPLVHAQKSTNPFANFAFGMGAAVALVLLFFGLAWVAVQLHFRPLGWLAFLCLIGALIAVVMACAALYAGFTATYLFTGGLAHTKNGNVQAVTWPEVDELLLWRAGGKTAMAGKLLCYYVVTFDGRKVGVELQSAKGDKSLGEQLQQIVARLGRPVVESGPYSGRLRP